MVRIVAGTLPGARARLHTKSLKRLERAKGIEPSYAAWEIVVRLDDARLLEPLEVDPFVIDLDVTELVALGLADDGRPRPDCSIALRLCVVGRTSLVQSRH